MEDSPSGLWRTLGKRVGVTASRVRISYPPPGLEPPKPLKSFGFRGFALVPSDCRFPPGSLCFDTFGSDLPRVSHIGTDDSENAFEPSPAVCSSSKSDRAPCVPSVGRFESLHVLRAFFFVLVRNNHSLRIASASQRIPVGPARRFPLTPSDERHTNAYGCHNSPFEPSINSLIHRQEAEERPSVGWVRRRNRQTPPASLPRVFASERHRHRHDRPRRRHEPGPHPPQRQEDTRQDIRFPIRPGRGRGQVAHHRAAHQEGGARHPERIDGGGVGRRQIGVAHTDGQGIHQHRRIILPQAAGHQKHGDTNPADGYSDPAGTAEGHPRNQPRRV